MKNNDLNSIQAKYNITFNLIEFVDESVFSGNALNPKTIPTLYHEYFHHYIFFNSLFYTEGTLRLYELASQVFTEKNIKGNIPLKNNLSKLVNRSKILQAQAEFDFWQKRSGYKFSNRDILAYKEIENIRFTESSGNFFTDHSNFFTSTLNVANKNHNSDFDFGAYTINESMAYILESFFHHIFINNDNDPPADYLPYKIISTFLLNNIYSIHIGLLLCDLSLQCADPGKYLIQLFNKYSSDLYKYGNKTFDSDLIERMHEIYFSEFNINPIKDYFHIIENQFHNSFKNAIGKNPYYLWIYNLHQENFERIAKKQLPDYFIPLIHKDKIKENVLNAFLSFPMPVIIDDETKKSGTYVAFKYNEKLYPNLKESTKYNLFFRALWTTFDQIYNGSLEFKCPLYDYCSNKFKDSECQKFPWKKGILEETCEFGLAANLFNLN